MPESPASSLIQMGFSDGLGRLPTRASIASGQPQPQRVALAMHLQDLGGE